MEVISKTTTNGAVNVLVSELSVAAGPLKFSINDEVYQFTITHCGWMTSMQ